MTNQMASYQSSKNVHFDEVQNSRHGVSKAQTCLHKILHIISTIPPEPTSKPSPFIYRSKASESYSRSEYSRFLDIELNSSRQEIQESDESLAIVKELISTNSTTAPTGVEEKLEAVEEKKVDDGGVNVNGVMINENEKLKAEDGFMGLLIEAAILISGEFKDEDDNKQSLKSCDNSSKTRLNRDRNAFWTADLCEEIAIASPPVVRSKRGRVQVLPYKYRDSIVEPLTRVLRNRSVVVSNKRRSR